MQQAIDTKPYFQRLLRPATRVLAALGVTPNQVTLTTIVLSLAAGAVIMVYPEKDWPILLVPVVLTLRVAFNHIDGLLAVEHNMKTPLGAILNELADVVSDASLYLPLALIPGVAAVLLVPVVVLGLLTEMIGVVAYSIGASRREDGPMSKKPRGLPCLSSSLNCARILRLTLSRRRQWAGSLPQRRWPNVPCGYAPMHPHLLTGMF